MVSEDLARHREARHTLPAPCVPHDTTAPGDGEMLAEPQTWPAARRDLPIVSMAMTTHRGAQGTAARVERRPRLRFRRRDILRTLPRGGRPNFALQWPLKTRGH
eukprot:5758425-Pyramimonas_sp.AAC.1